MAFRLEEVINRLEELAQPEKAKGMAHFAIPEENALGIKLPVLRTLAKEIGKDQALAEQLWHRREEQILAGGKPVSSAIIYERAVEPALGLDDEANLIGAVTKESLAKAYYLKGELIRNDPIFADRFRSEHHLVSMNAYGRAAELDPQLEYFTSQGFEMLMARPGSVSLEELQPILAKVVEFENAQLDPQALRLQAKGELLEAREIFDADKLKEPIHQAFDYFRSARAKIGENDPAYPSLLTDEAGTLVAMAFTVNGGDRAKQEEYLNEAVKLATKATTFEYRTHPAEAHVVLGNAKEDIGYYLHGDDPKLAENYFNEAKDHFLTALRADPTNSWRSQGKSNMSLGRLSYRHAWKGDVRNDSTRRDKLEEAARFLQDAIALTEHDQYHYSQSHYWAGEVDYSLAQLNESQREELIASADAHFNEAVTSAKEADDDSWVAYQIPWANHFANRAIDAYNAIGSAPTAAAREATFKRYLELEQEARGMIQAYLTERGDDLRPEQVYEGTLVVMRLTKVRKELRDQFMSAVEDGIRRIRVNAGESKTYEANLRLERSEYLANSAAFNLIRSTTALWGQAEENIVKQDMTFLSENHENLSNDKSFWNRVNLVKALADAVTQSLGDNPAMLRDSTRRLSDAIDKMDNDVVISRDARDLHLNMVIRLLRDEALTDKEKPNFVGDVRRNVGVLKSANLKPNVVRAYQDGLDLVEKLAKPE